MSLSRFHLPGEAWQSDTLTLIGDEAAHCSRVLRREVGEQIEIFDGMGRVATTTITAVTKSTVTARIDSQHQHEARAHQIHLLPAMIKAEPEPVRVMIRGALQPNRTAAARPAS